MTALTFPNASKRLAARLFLLAFCSTQPSSAQVSSADRALAQTLFEQGRALVATGDYPQACPKLAESHRLDPAGGTLLNLALCYEKWNKTASAWGAFTEAETLSRKDGRPERVRFAREHAAALKPNLSYLTLLVPASSEIAELELRVDERPIQRPAWGTPMPLDPGVHRVEGSAPGHQPWAQTITLGDKADKQTLEVPLLASLGASLSASTPLASAPPIPSGPPPAAPLRLPSERPTTQQSSGLSGSTTLGLVFGGVGIVSLGIGSYFGLRAFSSWSDRNAHCPGEVCDAQGVSYGQDTDRNATVANVAVGFGLVGLGVGTVLLLLSPRAKEDRTATSRASVRVSPTLQSGFAGLGVGGAW